MKIYYVASYEFQTPSLHRIESERETEKTIFVKKAEQLLNGYGYIPTRLYKSQSNIFDTAFDAIVYLHNMAKEELESCQKREDNIKKKIGTLEEIMIEMRR